MTNLDDEGERNQSSALLKVLSLAIFLIIICAFPFTSLPASFAQGNLQVTFFDVGQGDVAWIKTPDGLDVLIDGGKKGEGPGLVSYLQGQGVTDIEVLVLTHPHADHVGGLVTVLENMDVDQALMNCQPYSSAIYQTFLDLLATNSIPTTCVRDGDTFAWGAHISAAAVNPPEPLMSGAGSDTNNNSVALRMSFGTVDFLFTGDIEEEAETAILARTPTLEAEVLKVAHHGSKYSSTKPFLNKVDPEIAVISVGPNSYGHPAAEAIQRLGNVGAATYRTDWDGTVVVTTDGMTYSVQVETPPIPANGSFEQGLRIPKRWRGKNLTLKDRRLCKVAHYGSCSFRVVGTSARKSLQQVIRTSGSAGDTFTLAGWSKARNPSRKGGAYCLQAKIFHTDGTRGNYRTCFGKRTHGWQYRERRFTVAKDYNKVVVLLLYFNQTGKVWFDYVRLAPE